MLIAVFIRNSVYVLLILFPLLATASADTLDDEVDEAFRRGNHAQAIQLLKLSAEQGNAKSQSALGFLYSSFDDVKDLKEAEKWYRKAATQGDADAQYNCGYMYYRGKGYAHNYREALKWFRLAAAQGNTYAQLQLGFMYQNGEGVVKSLIFAHMWLNLAASQEISSLATDNLRQLEIRMTSAQIDKAQNLAGECEKRKYKNCD